MFNWKDEYSCNIFEIDKQHRRLLEIGSKLSPLISPRDKLDHYDEIMEVITELKNYTIYHFGYEESLLDNHGFELLDNHKAEHEAFVDKILELEKKDIDDNQKIVTMDILIFIADWIEKHILKTDHTYVEFLNSKGIY